ncbi:MAG: AIR synthase related protein, partial [Verrucomicrobiota bacterium]
LSESQERMLLIAPKGREKEVEAIFRKWDLHGVTIGHVTDDGMMRVKVGKKTVAEIPARKLADEAPIYHREARAMTTPALELPAEPKDYEKTLIDLLKSPTIASKNWVYRQYDHMVQDGTVVSPGSDAAVIRINLDRPDLGFKGSGTKYLAFTTDCNGTYCALDPYEGGKIAVAEAYRNLVCSGAKPLAVTDNLNFGNPHKPENFWQLRRCVEGAAEACAFFNTPVTGGNVSLYNESPAAAIDPTPTIGMLGLIDDPKYIMTQWFKDDGDIVLLLGDLGAELGGSEYLKRIHKLKKGAPPKMDLANAKRINDACLDFIRKGWVKSAHDCSEGGIAVALAECCMSNGDALVGATIDLPVAATTLFGETQSRIVISASPGNAGKILASGLPVQKIGVTGGDQLKIGPLAWPVAKLRDAWWNAIGRLMNQ